MTAAMAFFSLALTLNLTGIKVSEIRASDLTPSRLRATMTRTYYSTNEQVMKYYENLRLVYEMEARVRELRRSTEAAPAPAPAGDAQAGSAGWHRESQLDRAQQAPGAQGQPIAR